MEGGEVSIHELASSDFFAGYVWGLICGWWWTR